MRTVTLAASKRRWETSIPTSSERRNAPARPTRNNARSRRPAKSPGHTAMSRLTSAEISAAADRTGR